MEVLQESNAIERVYGTAALNDAKKAWDFLIEQPKLNVDVILHTHKLLMKNRPLPEDQIGFFRRIPVYIGGHEALQWTHIPDQIDSWILDVETSLQIPGKDGKYFKLDHITYERIHPFSDGNGRTGRMFLNWERVMTGLPLLIIHEGEEQMSYYEWFHKKK